MRTQLKPGVVLRRVISRVPNGEPIKRASGVLLPRDYVETLDCGCQRDVRLMKQPGFADGVSFQRGRLGDCFDPMRDLRPARRVCDAHSYPSATDADVRAAYMTRMRAFNSAIRDRAKARNLAFP